MVRRIFLASMFVLLASCTQDFTIDPVPDTPTTLSTDLSDAATHVTTDARGNAYVLGYRNKDVNADVNSGGVTPPAELFVSRIDVSGALEWLTVLESGGVDKSSLLGVVSTDAVIYALTQKEQKQPLYLHKLEPTVPCSGQKSSLKHPAPRAAFPPPPTDGFICSTVWPQEPTPTRGT